MLDPTLALDPRDASREPRMGQTTFEDAGSLR